MRTLLLFLALIVLSNVQAQETTNFTDSLGRKQGHWVFYGKDRPDSGVAIDGKVEEGDFTDDRKEGLWIKYHEDGVTPKLKGEYKNNRPAGVYTKTGNFGQKRETGSFEKNKQLDSLKRFYDNGQLEYEAWFNGDGRQEGRVNYYYPSGQLERTYFARNGVPYDVFHYDQSGKLIASQATPSVCGGPTLQPKPSKEPASEEEAKKYPRPEISETPNTRGVTFKKDGYNKIYRDDNEIFLDGVFKNGQLLDGKYYVYDNDGILLLVRVYKNGVYHSDGQL